VLCFTILNRTLDSVVRADGTNIHPDIVLADLSENQHFFEQYMREAQHHASVVAYFGNEQVINGGQHLQWFSHSESNIIYEQAGLARFIDETYYELRSPDGMFTYSMVAGADLDNQTLQSQLFSDAVRQQLNMFRTSLEYLENTEGLLYSIRGDLPSEYFQPYYISYYNINLDEQALDNYFKSQPVFSIMNGSLHSLVQSHSSMNFFTSTSIYRGGVWDIHLAFTQEAVSTQNSIYSAVRDMYIINFVIMAASAILILGLTVILMVGAGRRNMLVDGVKVRSDEVHFSPVDKPYLDLGLVLVACWTIFILYISVYIVSEYLSIINIVAVNILFAAMTLLIVPPALLWLISFVKRIKAGRFWKHTLIYAIVYSLLFGSLRFIVRKIKSLWAGTRLTLRVALIAFISFCVLFFVGFIGAETRGAIEIFIASLLFTAVVTVLLLLYSRRIHRLEKGARLASQGNYDTPIEAGGGELGSIANSINSISTGINKAVEEHLKSERLKTELITNVSHDIRTPLTSIITYTDLLDHEGLDCDRAPEYLDVLKQKSLRLKTLTEELFEAAKAATGNIDVNLTDLNVVSLINQVLGELDSAIKSSGLDLRVNLPEKLYARADGRLMQRVIENLLSNVFKYSLPSSRVYLDAFQSSDSEMRIDIKNISSQELNFDPSELTERFKRGDDSRADGGSGLGLSIVQSFVSAQGGKFEIAIDGDLFKATVLLPAAQTENQTP